MKQKYPKKNNQSLLCCNCHENKRQGKTGSYCAPCNAKYHNKYYHTHPTYKFLVTLWKRQRYQANPEEHREYMRNYRAKNAKIIRIKERLRYHKRKKKEQKWQIT